MNPSWFGKCSDKLIKQLMIQNMNPLAETKQEYFSGFERLYLEDLEDGKIPSFFKLMDNLTSLVISKSNVGKVVKSSSFPENIRSLAIGESGVTEFIFDDKGLSDLIMLNLSYNKLTSIPKNIAKLEILYDVVLKGNNIQGDIEIFAAGSKDVMWDLTSNPLTSVTWPENYFNRKVGVLIDDSVLCHAVQDPENTDELLAH